MLNPRIVAMVVPLCAAPLLHQSAMAQSPILKSGGTVATATGTSAITSADVDLDGHLDLVVTNEDDGTVSIFHGNGQGGYPLREDHATGVRAKRVAVGDFDLDGTPDLAVANAGDNTVTLLLGSRNGGFRNPRTFPIGPDIRALSFRDVAGGRPELLVMRDQAVEVYALRGRGGVVARGVYPFGAGFGEVMAGNFDGD